MAVDAFNMLHSGVQRALWDKRWPSLRPLQVEAIKTVLRTSRHVILAAATASGKTEAAFLPVLSKIATEADGSVRALYVGPLKALINDQFGRVEELCTHLEVPVHRWHGDVSASAKAKLVERPSGVLLITPESLESLFVNRSSKLPALFGGLRFVVIDELHAFLDNERGLHLRSLLTRVGRLVPTQPFRAIGLSATLGDFMPARAYLSPNAPDEVEVIEGKDEERELRMRLHAFRDLGQDAEAELQVAVAKRPTSLATEQSAEPPAVAREKAEAIVKHFGGKASLVFANAKAEIEELADLCTRLSDREHNGFRFLVHHGSLSAELREDVESAMRSGTAATTFCSSTLEMGVDIGSVEVVGQVGAPFSVASLKQRVGRGGRREGTSRVLRMYIECHEPGPKAGLIPRLHTELVRAIAICELMLSGWVEPPVPPECDLSTLSQQIVSVIAERGASTASTLHTLLCREGPFRDVEPALFGRLLRQLAKGDVLEQTGQGELILGLEGERLRKDKGFYAVFPTPDSYAVFYESQRLGEITTLPRESDHIAFGGRRWLVSSVDDAAKVIQVKPARGYKRPQFDGAGGELHDVVAMKMREIYSSDAEYAYLDSPAKVLLASARAAAQDSGIVQRRVVDLGGGKVAIPVWRGTRARLTLAAMLEVLGCSVADEEIALEATVSAAECIRLLDRCAHGDFEVLRLAKSVGSSVASRKYDEYVGTDLSIEAISRSWLNITGGKIVAAGTC